jgi:hypothetical protein
MFETRPGRHSIFSNIDAPETDSNRLSRSGLNKIHGAIIAHLQLAYLTAKFNTRTVIAADMLHVWHAHARVGSQIYTIR